jgi:hypothetical protein
MYLNYRQQCSLDWHTALLAAFALTCKAAAPSSGADVSDVGLEQFTCAQAGQECGQNDREIPFKPAPADMTEKPLANSSGATPSTNRQSECRPHFDIC